jgi:capsular polysaccharide biosynthesis protein
MTEQTMDARSLASLVRRRLRLVVAAVVLGAVTGALVLLLDHSPAYHSTSQVLLPPTAPSDQTSQGGRDSATEVRVAESQVVLEPAGRRQTPPLSFAQVQKLVSVSAPTSDVIQIVAKGRTAQRAEALARAVAEEEVAYQAEAASSLSQAEQDAIAARGQALDQSLVSVNDEIKKTNGRLAVEAPGSQRQRADQTVLGQLTAQQAVLVLQLDSLKGRGQASQIGGRASVIEAASPANRTEPILLYVVAIVVGALIALALTLMMLVGAARRDRRLRTRDEIADSLGCAVVGTVHAQPQRSVAGWAALLENYDPSVTDRWSLRQVLHHVGLGELMIRSGQQRSKPGHRRSLTVVTLSDDDRALAIGPQLASHAASLGIRTRLSTGQGHDAAASLWSAAASLRREGEIRQDLWVDNQSLRGRAEIELSVRLVVVDQRHPLLGGNPSGGVTLLAISSGAATADDLARTAIAAYECGAPISGVIVVDPDPLDHTTGRLLLRQRSEQGPLPTHITGVVASPSTPTPVWERGGAQ